MTAPTCRGYHREPHEARYTYASGYCATCNTRREIDVDPIEPPELDVADDDRAADVWERTERGGL